MMPTLLRVCGGRSHIVQKFTFLSLSNLGQFRERLILDYRKNNLM